MKDAAHWDRLNAKQRTVIAARCTILDHLNKHAAHVGKANAIGEFVQNARQGVLSPSLQRVLQIAHAK